MTESIWYIQSVQRVLKCRQCGWERTIHETTCGIDFETTCGIDFNLKCPNEKCPSNKPKTSTFKEILEIARQIKKQGYYNERQCTVIQDYILDLAEQFGENSIFIGLTKDDAEWLSKNFLVYWHTPASKNIADSISAQLKHGSS